MDQDGKIIGKKRHCFPGHCFPQMSFPFHDMRRACGNVLLEEDSGEGQLLIDLQVVFNHSLPKGLNYSTGFLQ